MTNWLRQALSPAEPGAPALRWRHRARVVEAACFLLLARVLIGLAPFARWERALGRRVAADSAAVPLSEAAALRGRRTGRAVEKAAALLPLEMKCLPQAMAVQAMLRRRGIPARLLIGVAPAVARGTPNDLHAWVCAGTETIIGGLPYAHRPILALQYG